MSVVAAGELLQAFALSEGKFYIPAITLKLIHIARSPVASYSCKIDTDLKGQTV